MIKAIIFDCFGVIRSDALVSSYTKFGGDFEADIDFITQALEQSNKGLTRDGTAGAFSKKLGISKEEWLRSIESGSIIQQPVLDYVKELRKKYKTGLLSNIGKGRISDIFEAGFLEQYFDVIIASGDIGFAKPEAVAYEITATKLGVRLDECVFTDDRPEYVEGAIAVGMQAIVFTTLEQFKRDLKRILNA